MNRVETIGNAILYLGDCRDILPQLPAPVGRAIVTDPPYGIAYRAFQPGALEYGPIEGDDSDTDLSFLGFAREGIVWGGNNFADKLPIGGWIVWDKRCSIAADRMMGSPFELAWCSKRSLFKMIRAQHGGAKNADALNGDVANEKRYHPTQKPVTVMASCIGFLSDKPHCILDPFMGSGSTGIAALKVGRNFIGIEIEEKYFEIACRRIEEAWRQRDLFIESKEDAVAASMPELLL